MVLYFCAAWGTTFTDVSDGSGALGDGTGGSGIAIADFNGDGLRDILALSSRSSPGTGPTLYIQDPVAPFTYTDQTQALAPGFLNRNSSRIAVTGDLDNDGLRDVVLADSAWLSVFLQRPDGTYGLSLAEPNGSDWEIISDELGLDEPTHPNIVTGLNIEGLALFDPDEDGVLDIQTGWRFTRVWQPGLSTVFLETAPDGLPSNSLDNDYLRMGDIDGDGVLDMIVGRGGGSGSQGSEDLFWGGANGFSASTLPDFDADNAKGAFLLCDFDGNGDLDLFRTVRAFPTLPALPNASNQVWSFDSSSGVFTSGGGVGLDPLQDTWAAACGDIDNDNDLDLVVAYYGGGIEIFRNTPAGWVTDNGGVVAGTVRGLALVDLDLDGDLDLFLNQVGDNQIWRNDLDDDSFFSIEIVVNVGTCENPILRDDFHARFQIIDGASSFATPVHTVKDSSGTGTSVAQPTHVGVGGFDIASPHRLVVETLSRQGSGDPIPPAGRSVFIPDLDAAHHVLYEVGDADADGIPIEIEGIGDADGDSVPNHQDWDSDGDQISDHTEAGPDRCNPVDTDGDWLWDFLDPDSDNDGVTDDLDCDRLDSSVSGPVSWYADADDDGFGGALLGVQCDNPGGATTLSGDCDDTQASVNPGAVEVCDSIDHDCDGSTHANAIDAQIGWLDADGDGHGGPDSLITCTLPSGYVGSSGDCDDAEPLAFPGGTEVCDGIDNDCDGMVDGDGATGSTSFFPDMDNDGFGAGASVQACTQPAGYRANDTDCDDANGAVYPNAPEQCNLEDDDCDGDIDEGVVDVTWYLDADGDNHGILTDVLIDCVQPDGYAPNPGDCDDSDPEINPLAVEFCDGVDSNCVAGESDAVDAATWYVDIDGDGWGAIGSIVLSCSQPGGTASQQGDCNDSNALQSPDQPESCDQIDNDCNLLVDDNPFDAIPAWADEDGDGRGNPAVLDAFCMTPPGWVVNDQDCDDQEPLAWTDAPEVCDAVDNDCDGLIDQADPDLAVDAVPLWFPDQDGDGFGAGVPVEVCTPPAAHVLDGSDCDDTAASVYPGASEVPDNGIDEDCDGQDLVGVADRDGDGLPDSEEPPGDYDGDGLENIDDPDSDNDGVLDGAEPSLAAVTSTGDRASGPLPTPVFGCSSRGGGPIGVLALLALLGSRRR